MKELRKEICFQGRKFVAYLGVLHWKDACINIKTFGQLDSMPDCIAIGYICSDKERYIVVHNFTDGVPDDYLCVPKQWGVSVYRLRG
jgi:hypothetical protein